MLPWPIKVWISQTIVLLELIDFMQSGINLFSDQSPPPITFPALTVAKPHFFIFQKL